jgi:hypothetical protein
VVNVIMFRSTLNFLLLAILSVVDKFERLGPTQPHIQWVPGALSLGVKRPEREADHSSKSSAKVKNAWSDTSTPPISLHGVVLD